MCTTSMQKTATTRPRSSYSKVARFFVGGGVERTVNTGEALLLICASRELSVGVELAATVELGGSGDARPAVMPISAGLEQLLILASGQNDIKVIGPRVDRGGRMFVHSRPCRRGG